MNISNLVRSALVPPSVRERGVGLIRDPKAATQQVTRVVGIHGSLPSRWDADYAIQKQYLVNLVVFRCINIIADSIASLPFRAGKDPGKQDIFDVNAPLARLLGPPPGSPNPDCPPSQLWRHTVAQYILTGRFAWEIEYEGTPAETPVVALWPLLSQYLRAIPSNGGSKYFTSFEYRPATGDPKELAYEQCFYHWRPSAYDMRQPESPLEAARMEIASMVEQNIYDYAFLANGGVPANVVVTQAFADPAQFQAFKRQFNGEYGGPNNAGKTAFVEYEAEDGNVSQMFDIKVIGQSSQQSQLFEKYDQKVNAICMAVGVPKSKLDASGRTFDNAAAEDETYERNTVIPLATSLQEAINTRLAPLVGDEVGWFELDDLKVIQSTKQRNVWIPVSVLDAYNDRVATLNEARHELDLPPIDGGDELAALPAPVIIPVEGGDIQGIDNPPGDSAEPPQQAPALPTAMPTPVAASSPRPEVRDAEPSSEHEAQTANVELEDDRRAARAEMWRSFNRQATSLEKMWAKSMRRLFKRQVESTISRLEGKRGRQMVREGTPNPADIFDRSYWEIETADHVTGLYQSVVAVAGAKMADQFGFDFDLEAPRVTEFIQERSNQLAGQVTETTYDSIHDALAQGVSAGEGIPDIADRIRDVFDEADDTRAEMIARTEVISAYNGGSVSIAQDLGSDVVGGQEWLATQDSRVRETHAEADGQVSALGDGFQIGDATIQYPGDPDGPAEEVINCRCTLLTLTPDEMDDTRSRTQWRRVEEVEAELLRIATEGLVK